MSKHEKIAPLFLFHFLKGKYICVQNLKWYLTHLLRNIHICNTPYTCLYRYHYVKNEHFREKYVTSTSYDYLYTCTYKHITFCIICNKHGSLMLNYVFFSFDIITYINEKHFKLKLNEWNPLVSACIAQNITEHSFV